MQCLKALKKLQLENKNEVFTLSNYSDNTLSLQIVDLIEKKAYTGQISKMEIRNQAASIRQTYEEFLENAKKALFDSVNENFVYSIEVSKSYLFKWESVDEEETIILLGSIPLKVEDIDCILGSVLSNVTIEMHKLNSHVNAASNELEHCKMQVEKNITDLKSATDAKEKLETELYSKFILILNEKKRRIRMLQQIAKPQFNQNQTVSKVKKFTHPLCNESSDEEAKSNEASSKGDKNSLEFAGESDIIETTSRKRNRIR